MKTCPNCAEIVETDELICRFCGKDIPLTDQEFQTEITDSINPDPEIDYAALLQEETHKYNNQPSSPMKWIKTVFIVIFIIYSFISAIDRQIFSGTLFTGGFNRLTPGKSSGLSLEEARFVKKVENQGQVCAVHLKEFLSYIIEEENPNIYYEQSRHFDMLKLLDNIQLSCTTFDDITPVPPRFALAYEYLVSSSNECNQFVQYYSEGITELDQSKIQIANEHLRNSTEYYLKVKEELERIINK